MAKGRKSSKTFDKKVKQIVATQLSKELEEKTAVIGLQSIPFKSNILSGDMTSEFNFIRLLPNINKSGGNYNSRIGNEIRLKSLNIKMLMQFAAPATATTDEAQLGVRVMIVRQKDENNYMGALGNLQGNKLIENGLIGSPGPASFSGSSINLFQKINRDAFSVKYDKVFYMSRERQENRGTATTTQFNERNYIAPPSKPAVVDKTLTFGRDGLKLTFADDASAAPMNFPYFVLVGYASTTSSVAQSNDLVEYTYTANALYTDA